MAYIADGVVAGEECFLCAEAADVVSKPVVDRTEHTFTLLNRFPYSSGHVMVVPNRHVCDVRSLTPLEGVALFAAMQRALQAITTALRPDGFNIGVNQGEAGGASASHTHMHIVPRWQGDTNFMPVLANVRVLVEDLDATADRLREIFAALPN